MPTAPPAPSLSGFGDVLRRLRVSRGLTQELLADRSGLSVRGISDLERGERSVPQRATIERLIAGLELPNEEQDLLLAAARREPRPRPIALDVRWPGPLATRHDAFVGRAAEVSAIVRALHDPDARLLTLTGPPGVGKTRLALETVRRLAALIRDDIVVVDLAPITHHSLVLPAVAAAMGVRESGSATLRDRLRARLATRQTLLVLDNFEHVLPAASIVADLLQAKNDVRLLITSREPLRIPGEQTIPVLPLATPPHSAAPGVRETIGHDAVELFVMRARESDPEFHLNDGNAGTIAALCVRFDGLPLAIELAAARIPHIAPAAILEQLDQRRPVLTAERRELPVRQRTLANAIDWSYELLSEADQRLFRHLSVFSGGFTEQAANAVAIVGGEASVSGGLALFTDKCLLVQQMQRAGIIRFAMLETIREYGLERLAASGEEGAKREAHAAYFLAFAEQAARDFYEGAGQREAIGRLQQEQDNLRLALAWALDRDDPIIGLRLASALWRFWWIHGQLSEGQRCLNRAVEQSSAAPSAALARALIGGGRLAWVRGDLATARDNLERALMLEPDPFDRCEALNALGDVARHDGAYDRAEEVLNEALDRGREFDDRFHVGASLHNLGAVALDRGEHDRARVMLEESLNCARESGHQYLANSALHYLSRLVFEQGDYAAAASLRCEELAIQWELAPASAHGAARFLEGIAQLAVVQEQLVQATRLFGTASGLREGIEDVERVERTLVAPWITTARDLMGADAFTREWRAGHGVQTDAALAEAANLLMAWNWDSVPNSREH